MRLVVYPNGGGLSDSEDGVDDDGNNWVGVHVQNEGQFEVKVKSQFITDVRTSEMEEATLNANEKLGGGMWGFWEFISHEDIKEHYKAKDFVVKVKVEMEGEVVKIVGENMEKRKRKFISQEVSETAYKRMAWTNFVLEFEGEELACHRVILAGASPVLAAMLEPANEHREAVEGRAVIQLPAAVGRAFVR